MITFEQARTIVAGELVQYWPEDADFTVAPWGWETDDVYIVVAGPYAVIYEPRNQAEFKWARPDNAPVICVNKETGAMTFTEEAPEPSTPCGAPNPDDEYE